MTFQNVQLHFDYKHIDRLRVATLLLRSSRIRANGVFLFPSHTGLIPQTGWFAPMSSNFKQTGTRYKYFPFARSKIPRQTSFRNLLQFAARFDEFSLQFHRLAM